MPNRFAYRKRSERDLGSLDKHPDAGGLNRPVMASAKLSPTRTLTAANITSMPDDSDARGVTSHDLLAAQRVALLLLARSASSAAVTVHRVSASRRAACENLHCPPKFHAINGPCGGKPRQPIFSPEPTYPPHCVHRSRPRQSRPKLCARQMTSRAGIAVALNSSPLLRQAVIVRIEAG
jgi:hypothetical protein